ncbi:MAG: hypothetical protein HQL70_04265 [Magnetococcales bacterium]|nr:hypothetical protein [Magnetococcales bacterium]
MFNFLLSLGFLLLLALSLYGWGRGLSSLLSPDNSFGWAYNATFGISIWIFFGGFLNLFSMVNASTLWCLLLFGLVISGYFLSGNISTIFTRDVLYFDLSGYIKKKISHQSDGLGFFILYSLIIALLFFYTYALMPATIFNYGDDYSVYNYRPILMFESGTIGHNNPFNGIPLDSLGGHAFMQSLFLLVFDHKYLNGFDAILCFFLGIFLVLEFGRKIGASFNNQLLAVTFLVVLHPQYVNNSPLYANHLLILAAIIYSMTWWKLAQGSTSTIELVKAGTPFAFFLSALVTLKTNIGVYTVIFFFIHFGLGWLFSQRRNSFFTTYAVSGLFTILLITPWMLVFKEKFITIFQEVISGNGGKIIGSDLGKQKIHLLDLFSNERLFWGGGLLEYSAFVSLVCITAFISLFFLWKHRKQYQLTSWLLPLISASLTTAFFYFIGSTIFPWSFKIDYAVRYATPAMLASASLIPFLILSFRYSSKITDLPSGLNYSSSQSKTILYPFFQGVIIILIGLFLAPFSDRIVNMAYFGNMLSYPAASSQNHIAKVRAMDSKEHREELKMVQNLIPKGAKVLVKISTPLLLDHGRNKILSIWGLASPWNKISSDTSVENTIKFMKENGIDYILWQYSGFGTRDIKTYKKWAKDPNRERARDGRNGISFTKKLVSIANRNRKLYFNKNTHLILFEIG